MSVYLDSPLWKEVGMEGSGFDSRAVFTLSDSYLEGFANHVSLDVMSSDGLKVYLWVWMCTGT